MLKPSLQLKLGQTLTMTPQLQQAIRLLQLPVLDLSAQIQEALEENIMLEMEDLPDVPKTSGESTAEFETIKAEDNWQSSSMERIRDGGWNGEGRPISEYADLSGQTLREHLLWQLELEDFSPREVLIGEALVDAINDDGYLTTEPEDVKDILDNQAGVTLEEIELTLTKVQGLDPVGIGARSLSECLVLQLYTAGYIDAGTRTRHQAGARPPGSCCQSGIRGAATQSPNLGGRSRDCAGAGQELLSKTRTCR